MPLFLASELHVKVPLEEVLATQTAPAADKGPTINEQFKAQTEAFEENKKEMLDKVEKKACLVEESKE